MGRFLSADTIVPGPGNPQALNRYSYTNGNPLKYTDPSGHGVDCGMGDDNCQNGIYVPPAPVPDSNDVNVQDSYLAYTALAYDLGRLPTVKEILQATIASEFWVVVDQPTLPANSEKTIKTVGEEGVAREYYQACGGSNCQQADPRLYHFMAGYAMWLGRANQPDVDQEQRASKAVGLLSDTFAGTAQVLKTDVQKMTGSYAAQQGWTTGFDPNSSWSLWGPTSAAPDGRSFGTGQSDFAILAVDLGNGSYDYFTTGAQTANFGGR